MLIEFVIVLAVSHITVAIAVCIQTCKRGRENCVMNTVIGYILDNLAAVTVIQCVFIAYALIKHFYFH